MNKLIASFTSSRARTASKHVAVAAVGLSALTLVSANASAGAEIDFMTPRETVHFQDLDLSKQDDAKRLYRRLKLAANQVCVGYGSSSAMLPNSARGRCIRNAISGAVETIGHPNLTALHQARSDVKLAQGKSKPASNT